MSITKINNLNSVLFKYCAIQNDVRTDRDKVAVIADFIRQQKLKGDRDWSNHEIERRAKAGGYTLSNGTVWSILNNRYKSITDDTLEAIAYVFSVPKSEVFSL